MIPSDMMAEPRLETELSIHLLNRVDDSVDGLDKPARVEGQPWDHFLVDEYADCSASSGRCTVYPAHRTDRKGTADLIGVPRSKSLLGTARAQLYDRTGGVHVEVSENP